MSGSIGGEKQKLFYRTVGFDKGGTVRWSQSLEVDTGARESMDARAEAVAWFANFLNEKAFDSRVTSELKQRRSEIVSRMPKGGGVLICVNYVQNVEFGYRNFENLFVANAGFDFRAVLKAEIEKPKMLAMPKNRAFQMSTNYIWVNDVSEIQ